MESVTALWRSMEGGDWELVRLFKNGESGDKRHTALEAAKNDIVRWTLPVQYKVTVEHVETI